MIDLVPLIDAIGEPATLTLGTFVFALLFGVAAERSGFCTRSAVLEIMDRKAGRAFVTWLAAFGTAVLLVQIALANGLVAAGDSRFFATAQSLSGPIIGGILFGIGMALARGCSSRLMVLGASGNVRALATLVIMGVVAWLALAGPLAPLRDLISGLATTQLIGSNSLTGFAGPENHYGIAFGAMMAAAAVFLAIRSGIGGLQVSGGALIGLAVAGLWVFTSALYDQVFEPIAVESLSFIRPTAGLVTLAMGEAETAFSFDNGVIAGVVAGALVASIVFGSFGIRRFSDDDAPHFLRYVAGGALMGFGGVTAAGCTIGAGFTGGSVLAASSLLGLASMVVATGATQWFLTRQKRVPKTQIMVPAE